MFHMVPLEAFGLEGSAQVDPITGNLLYRQGDIGYSIADYTFFPPDEQIHMLTRMAQSVEEQRRKLLQKEVDFQKLTAKDLTGMTMAEYAQVRKNYGVSLNTGNGFLSTTVQTPKKTEFEEWQAAREAFINGTGTLEQLLVHVRTEDADRYDRVVEEEYYVPERVRKHRINWGRWPLWRWVVAWFHRRGLGRNRNGQDNPFAALRERPGAAPGSPLDYSGF